jgi:predicted short-subunit dehydrogenase-like oxidoreductase (DUF2520 family)
MHKTPTPPDHALSRVAIVGAGRLGSALADALRAAGLEVEGPLGRGARPDTEVTLLCVPDGEIAAAAAEIGMVADRRPTGAVPRFVGHTSGATSLDTLAAAHAEPFGLHPLQTFAGGEGADAFAGAGCAIAGTTPAGLAVARLLAERLRMTAIEISDPDRAAYHAAASVASNFLVTLQAAAEELAAGAGLAPDQARSLLVPLVRSTVENWAARGPERALTGPVARGDEETVERQRDAVAEVAPRLLPLFDELVEHTRALAGRPGAVPA